MSYTELARTRPVPSAWENLTDEQNDAQTAAIYGCFDVSDSEPSSSAHFERKWQCNVWSGLNVGRRPSAQACMTISNPVVWFDR